MTKKGYKNKFLTTFLVLSIGLYIFFLYASKNFDWEALVGQYVYSLVYTFIPSAIIALVWEFFKE